MIIGDLQHKTLVDPKDWPKATSLKGLRQEALKVINSQHPDLIKGAWLIANNKEAVQQNKRMINVIRYKKTLRSIIIFWNIKHPEERV